jgi:hypothetical protein
VQVGEFVWLCRHTLEFIFTLDGLAYTLRDTTFLQDIQFLLRPTRILNPGFFIVLRNNGCDRLVIIFDRCASLTSADKEIVVKDNIALVMYVTPFILPFALGSLRRC